MSEPRVIKKYPNRRLYDTIESRYITLSDVQRLVIEKIDFIVFDKKNGADITRSILLQVISEQEHRADPILSQEFMTQLIRAYGNSAHAQVGAHLEQSLKLYFAQHPLRERPKPAGGSDSPRLRVPPDEVFKAIPRERDGHVDVK